MTLLNVGEINL